jgi:predicted SprT family Zn-dependent metalloprotease
LQRFSKQIHVSWNYRFTSIVGRATFASDAIELSAQLWNYLDDEEKTEAIIHEACHLFVFERFCRRRKQKVNDHGEEWKELMRRCGYSDARAQMQTPAPTISKQYLVYCRCRKHFITPQMLGRIRRGHRLFCPDCNSDVKLEPYAE